MPGPWRRHPRGAVQERARGRCCPHPWVGATSEGYEWLDDSVQLPVHGVERLLEVAERERVGGLVRRIHASGLDDPQQACCLEMMAMDSEKHARLLQFVQRRL